MVTSSLSLEGPPLTEMVSSATLLAAIGLTVIDPVFLAPISPPSILGEGGGDEALNVRSFSVIR